jgi:hypothetical protein
MLQGELEVSLNGAGHVELMLQADEHGADRRVYHVVRAESQEAEA